MFSLLTGGVQFGNPPLCLLSRKVNRELADAKQLNKSTSLHHSTMVTSTDHQFSSKGKNTTYNNPTWSNNGNHLVYSLTQPIDDDVTEVDNDLYEKS